MRRLGLSLLLLCAALTLASPGALATEAPLRVLSFNAWGVWLVTPSRQARFEAMGAKIAALAPDVVAMQEVWLDEDADRLVEDLGRAGLVHSRRFTSVWPGHSGLLLASRYPIIQQDFVEYAEGTHPHVPWHVDWMAGKGMARVRIQTPQGPVDVANTHVQASYGGTHEYDLIQLAQLLQAADFLDTPRDVPLIVAGDLNVRCESLQYRLFSLRAGLAPTQPGCGIDSISLRAGGDRRVRVEQVQSVLTKPVALSDGTVQPLSDHPGVLAVLSMESQPPSVAEAAPPRAWTDLLREALPQVHAHQRLLSQAQLQHGVLSLVLLQAGLLAWLIRTRRVRFPLPPQAPLRLLSVLTLMGALWFAYLGLSYAPKHLSELERVKKQLQGPLEAAMLGAQATPIRSTSVP